MKEKLLKIKWHLIAILTVAIWGTTFISTKLLIRSGLTPQEIFFLRFLMAYIGILFISPRKLWADNWRDELWRSSGCHRLPGSVLLCGHRFRR